MANETFYDIFIRNFSNLEDYKTFTNESIKYNQTFKEIENIRKWCGKNSNISPLGEKSEEYLDNLESMVERFKLDLSNMPGYSEKDSKRENISKLAIGLTKSLIDSYNKDK